MMRDYDRILHMLGAMGNSAGNAAEDEEATFWDTGNLAATINTVVFMLGAKFPAWRLGGRTPSSTAN